MPDDVFITRNICIQVVGCIFFTDLDLSSGSYHTIKHIFRGIKWQSYIKVTMGIGDCVFLLGEGGSTLVAEYFSFITMINLG